MVAAIIALTLAASPVVVPAPEKDGAFTPDERRQALEALQTIAKTFGEKEQPQQQQQQQPAKTMAEVADKALDLSSKYIGQAAAVIEKAAPRVWEVMVRQQYAKALGELVGPLITILTIILFSSITRSIWKPRDPTEDFFTRDWFTERGMRGLLTAFIPGVVVVICSITFASRFADSVMYLINPEYYAIKDLVQLLLKGG
jgi:hypothetical protein